MCPFDASELDPNKPLDAQVRANTEQSKWRKYVITPVNKFVCMFTGKKDE